MPNEFTRRLPARVSLLACCLTACGPNVDSTNEIASAAPLTTNGISPPALLDNATPCGRAQDCYSGYCVDGVCCNTACGGGATSDCLSCNASPDAAGFCTTPSSPGSACVTGCDALSGDIWLDRDYAALHSTEDDSTILQNAIENAVSAGKRLHLGTLALSITRQIQIPATRVGGSPVLCMSGDPGATFYGTLPKEEKVKAWLTADRDFAPELRVDIRGIVFDGSRMVKPECYVKPYVRAWPPDLYAKDAPTVYSYPTVDPHLDGCISLPGAATDADVVQAKEGWSTGYFYARRVMYLQGSYDQNMPGVTIRNCTFQNLMSEELEDRNADDGLLVNMASNVDVVDNRFVTIAGRAMAFEGVDGFRVKDNLVQHTKWGAIAVRTSGRDGLIDGNRIDDCEGAWTVGVDVQGNARLRASDPFVLPSNIEIRGNVINGRLFYSGGIRAISGHNIRVHNNEITLTDHSDRPGYLPVLNQYPSGTHPTPRVGILVAAREDIPDMSFEDVSIRENTITARDSYAATGIKVMNFDRGSTPSAVSTCPAGVHSPIPPYGAHAKNVVIDGNILGPEGNGQIAWTGIMLGSVAYPDYCPAAQGTGIDHVFITNNYMKLSLNDRDANYPTYDSGTLYPTVDNGEVTAGIAVLANKSDPGQGVNDVTIAGNQVRLAFNHHASSYNRWGSTYAVKTSGLISSLRIGPNSFAGFTAQTAMHNEDGTLAPPFPQELAPFCFGIGCADTSVAVPTTTLLAAFPRHLAGVTTDGRVLYGRSVDQPPGAWVWSDVAQSVGQSAGPFSDVDVERVESPSGANRSTNERDTHVLLATQTGGLLHAVRTAEGAWSSGFVDVLADNNAGSIGSVIAVGMTAGLEGSSPVHDRELHVVAVTGGGELGWSLRNAAGQFSKWVHLRRPRTVRRYVDACVAYSRAADGTQGPLVCGVSMYGSIFCARRVGGSWEPLTNLGATYPADFTSIDCDQIGEGQPRLIAVRKSGEAVYFDYSAGTSAVVPSDVPISHASMSCTGDEVQLGLVSGGQLKEMNLRESGVSSHWTAVQGVANQSTADSFVAVGMD